MKRPRLIDSSFGGAPRASFCSQGVCPGPVATIAAGTIALLLATAACTPKASSAEAQGPANAVSAPATAQPLRIEFASTPAFVAPALQNLRRGINLGNGFDAPNVGEWGVTPSEKHFAMAAAAGLDHIRLPVRFSTHALTQAPFTIDEAFFAQIDWAIAEAQKNGLSIIVDLHHYEEIMTAPQAHEERFVALWRQIAERYKDQPPSVLFELLNEPNSQLTPDRLNKLMARTISVIRESNPTRSLIVDCFFWAAPEQLQHLRLPDDPHLAASFHMYQPILFTHQGAHWMNPEFQTRGLIFPGPPANPVKPVVAAENMGWTNQWLKSYNQEGAADNPSSPAAVAREFEFATQFARHYNIPVYMGEFGAIDFAEPVSRENYLRLVRREAERRGMAWALWDDGGRLRGMYLEQNSWVGAVARALFTEQPGDALPDGIVAID